MAFITFEVTGLLGHSGGSASAELGNMLCNPSLCSLMHVDASLNKAGRRRAVCGRKRESACAGVFVLNLIPFEIASATCLFLFGRREERDNRVFGGISVLIAQTSQKANPDAQFPEREKQKPIIKRRRLSHVAGASQARASRLQLSRYRLRIGRSVGVELAPNPP